MASYAFARIDLGSEKHVIMPRMWMKSNGVENAQSSSASSTSNWQFAGTLQMSDTQHGKTGENHTIPAGSDSDLSRPLSPKDILLLSMISYYCGS